jgi:WD40 repeat protein
MPPEGNEGPTEKEISIIQAWIDAGAKSPSGAAPDPTKLVTPRVPLQTNQPREPIHAAAFSPDGKQIALAGYGRVRIVDAAALAAVTELTGMRGHVSEVAFSADGQELIAAAGEPGLFGELQVWTIGNPKPRRTIVGHRDALYAAVALPGQLKLIATGSYDEQIRLWDLQTGKEVRLLSGHNGPIFGLSASSDGRWLASASGDRTVKIWDVASGERLDTLGQSLKELYTVAFSPDGKRLIAGGVDNRIRLWQIGKSAREGDNPLVETRFAHEGAILRLVWSHDGRWLASSAEDRTVKIWHGDSLAERHLLERQSDTPAALAFSPDGHTLLVARLDGSFTLYDVESGTPRSTRSAMRNLAVQPARVKTIALPSEGKKAKPKPQKSETTPARPELTSIEPRGVQIGAPTRLTLKGKQLEGIDSVSLGHPKLTARLLAEPAASPTQLTIEVLASDDMKPGSYDVSLVTAGGATNKLKLHVDDLLQQPEAEPNDDPAASLHVTLPVSCWGALAAQGDADCFSFAAAKGQTVVFDAQAQSLGSKLNAVLTLFDPQGRVVAANNDFDGQSDPLLAYPIATTGRYTVRVSDLTSTGSAGHFYRLSIGLFPYVTACYPLGVPANQDCTVEFVGYNLPAGASAQVKAVAEGEVEVPIILPGARSRRPLTVVVGKLVESQESEPNDGPAQASSLSAPGTANGRIGDRAASGSHDTDLFRFAAAAGEPWVIETEAARRGSPIDTKIEVLDHQGKPIERLLLQATRDSYITFRGIDSQTIDVRVKNWEEMELNDLLYMQGEVCKIFRLPQGPDSGFNFYARAGKRRSMFDSSPTTHALDEPCYTVSALSPGAKLVSKGLPVFPLYYANDDEGDRKLGSDSRLLFTAPRSGEYLVRVTDVRQQGGDRYAYRLTVRRPTPDFSVTLGGANPTINAGSGKAFTLTAERNDGFDGQIDIIIEGLPKGFIVSQPLSIQSGHLEAKGVLWAAADASQPDDEQLKNIQVVARATIDGATVERPVNGFGKIKLVEKPQLTVTLEPAELVIAPGATITATLRIGRNGFKERVQFAVDNLPHGVIVDNIGLNGVLIPDGQSERQIFLTARSWVPDTTRPFHAVANSAGAQALLPITLHVRRAAEVARGRPQKQDN